MEELKLLKQIAGELVFIRWMIAALGGVVIGILLKMRT